MMEGRVTSRGISVMNSCSGFGYIISLLVIESIRTVHNFIGTMADLDSNTPGTVIVTGWTSICKHGIDGRAATEVAENNKNSFLTAQSREIAIEIWISFDKCQYVRLGGNHPVVRRSERIQKERSVRTACFAVQLAEFCCIAAPTIGN